MSESIVEKLGITPGPWSDNGGGSSIYGKGVYIKDDDVPEDLKGIKGNDYQLICDMRSHKFNYDIREWITKNPTDKSVILASIEMLEALIEGCLMVESITEFIEIDSREYSFRNNSINIIEKATGRTWAEIKEML